MSRKRTTWLALKKEPRKAAKLVRVKRTMEALEEAVGGAVEHVYLGDKAVVLMDYDAFMGNKRFNLLINQHSTYGTILVLGLTPDESGYDDVNVEYMAKHFPPLFREG